MFTNSHSDFNYQSASLYNRGLTLLELLIVMAIFMLSLGVVAPSLQKTIAKAHVVGQLNEVNMLLRYARLSAMDEYATTTICPSADFENCSLDWNEPLILFMDENTNGVLDSSEQILRIANSQQKYNLVKGPNSYIRFYASGANSSPATLRFCSKQDYPDLNRALYISLQGRARLSTDSNNDNIHDNGSGRVVTC